jgi:hypothetical protein
MEKIMSKSNDVSTLDHRPLADSELDAVTGGVRLNAGVQIKDPQKFGEWITETER